MFEVFSSGKYTDKDVQHLESLIQRIGEIRANATKYNKENGQGTLVNINAGQIKDIDDLKASLEQYLSAYKNVNIEQDRSNPNALIAKYTDMNGELKQIKASYDSITNSMRIKNQVAKEEQVVVKTSNGFLQSYANSWKDIAKSYLGFMSGYMLINRMISALKQGVSSLKEYDSALTTISYTMNITSQQLNDLGENAEMAEDLSVSLDNALEIYQIYANMSTTAEEIEAIGIPTAILSNLSGIDAATAADEIQAVIQAFSGLGSSADEAMHIADVYDFISAQIKVDYSKGIEDIAEAVENVGIVADQAGLSFEQLSAIVAKTAESTRQSGSTIANALKTIMVRISKASTMSDEVDNDTLSKASKALNDIGIAVYEADGKFREFDVIMGELSQKWDTLTDAQQANLSFQIAATRQTSLFRAILNTWTSSMDLATQATETQGNALKNQEKYEQSYVAKLQQISNQAEEFWLSFLDTEGFKKVLDNIIGFLELINKLPPALVAVTTVGLAPMIGMLRKMELPKNFGKPEKLVSKNVLKMPNDTRVLMVGHKFTYVAA